MSELTTTPTSSETFGLVPLDSKLANAIGLLRGETGFAGSSTTCLGLPRRTAIGSNDLPADMPDLDTVDSWPEPLRSSLGGAVWADYTSEHGWTGIVTEYRVLRYNMPETIDLARKYWAAYRETCAPLNVDGTVAELTKLRVKVAKRAEDELDWQLSLDALLDELEPYPADILVSELRAWPRHSKWWPTLKELKEVLDRRVQRRLGMLRTLEKIAKSQPIRLAIAPGAEP